LRRITKGGNLCGQINNARANGIILLIKSDGIIDKAFLGKIVPAVEG